MGRGIDTRSAQSIALEASATKDTERIALDDIFFKKRPGTVLLGLCTVPEALILSRTTLETRRETDVTDSGDRLFLK